MCGLEILLWWLIPEDCMCVQSSTCQHFDTALLVEFIGMVGTLPVECVPPWCLTLSTPHVPPYFRSRHKITGK